MANNITLHQKNNTGSYDNLYPRTTADHTILTETTSDKYGLTGGNAEEVVVIYMNYISIVGIVKIYVKDPSGNPVVGAIAQGIQGNPVTNSSGFVSGILVSNPVIVKSPYIDLKDSSVDVTDYIGTTVAVNVVLSAVADGAILRYTTSTNVKFNGVAKTIDVCCVGGGGGGGSYFVQGSEYHKGGGGGGGAIVNGYGIAVTANTPYLASVGVGGAVGQTAGAGGTTSFMSVSAPGGGGAYMSSETGSTGGGRGGVAGLTGCGDGGSERETIDGGSNTTISEFDDGKTFYSGGGGAGVWGQGNQASGGSPNGADGGYIHVTGAYEATVSDASTPGIGGGGGGGAYWHSGAMVANPSSGGSGLVAIRIHTS